VAYTTTIADRIDGAAAAQLWERAGTATVFNHPGWWQAAIEAFGDRRPLKVIEAYCDGRLIGLWPMWVKLLGARETFVRIIEPIGARVTDYVAPLIDRDHAPTAVTAALLATLRPCLDARTMLLISKVPAELGAGAALAEAFAGRGMLTHRSERTCPYMLLPATAEALEQQWDKRHRADVRRQSKRLAAFGKLSLSISTERTAIAERLPVLFELHRRSWGARTGVSEFASGPMAAFLLDITRRLPESLMHYSELTLTDQPVSAHFGFADATRLMWYKPAFNIAWQNYSPGKLHIAFAAREAIATGRRELDFMQGMETYKLDWTNGLHTTQSFAVSRNIAYPFWAWNTKVRRLAAEYRY